jgi:hypothetical protein
MSPLGESGIGAFGIQKLRLGMKMILMKRLLIGSE